MKTKIFIVPVEQMLEFATIISEHDLTARIIEPEDEAIVAEVDCEPTGKSAIFEIIESLDDEL